MAHAAKQIRDAVVSELTGLASTGSNVFPFRVFVHDTFPSLAIFTSDESRLDDQDQLSTAQVREMTLTVEARAKASSALEDTLDQIRAEVETALMDAVYVQASTTLQSLVSHLVFSDMSIEISDEHEQPLGLMTMNFAIQYQIDGTDPETIID